MDASILDLRRRMPEVLRALDRNESVRILYRGRPRARLVPDPPAASQRESVAKLAAFGLWKDHEEAQDVAAYIRELRQRRVGAV